MPFTSRSSSGGRRRFSVLGGKAGMAPGTPVFVGERKLTDVSIDIIEYGPDHFSEKYGVSVEDCAAAAKSPHVKWINVNGIHDIGLIERIGAIFGMHPLTLEDIVNTTQRPKKEEFPGYLFIVLKMITCEDVHQGVQVEQLSLILGADYVISFQESKGDIFDPLRARVRSAKGRIRALKSDYLAYAIMDSVVDNYFLALERMGEYIENIDDEIVLSPTPEHMREIHRLKRVVLTLRKAVWPLREEIGAIEKLESGLIDKSTKVFLRDLYDHTIQVIDMVESYRGVIGGMHETFLSSASNRMNDIMRVLTIISTIFIPLTFITGLYGMNFQHMPGLGYHWSYAIVWGVMLAIGVCMLIIFKKKKWW
jgi:magnesium transporter